MKPVKIEMSPYNALAIFAFVREYFNDSNKNTPEFKAMHEAIDEYESQVFKNINQEQLEDAIHENSVNKLIGKSPKK